jgi:hypothetical protein
MFVAFWKSQSFMYILCAVYAFYTRNFPRVKIGTKLYFY